MARHLPARFAAVWAVVTGCGQRGRRIPFGRSRGLTVAIGVIVALGIGSPGFAYWTSTGTGTGSAAASATQPLTLTPATPTSWLYPGGHADVALAVTNPNPIAVRIRWLSLNPYQGTGGYTVDAGHAACGVSALSFGAQSNNASGWTIPARTGSVDGSLDIDLAGALSMSLDAPAACQGATFSVYLSTDPDYQQAVLGTASLVSYWRLGADPMAADSFTGAVDTTLGSHTGEIGATWTHYSGASPSVITDAGRVRSNGTGGSLDYASATPSSPDYAVEADLYNASYLAGDQLGVLGRLDTGTGNYYLASFDRSDDGYHLWKMTATGGTALGCWCDGGPLTAGQAHRLRLEMTGSSTTVLNVYVDGVLRLSATDTTSPYTTAGRGGIQDGDSTSTTTRTNTTGMHADNFRIVPATGTVVADSRSTNNGTFVGSPLLNVPGALAGGFNPAVRYNGTSTYATVPDAPSLDLVDAAPFTLEAWVQRNDASPARQTILDKGTGSFQWVFDTNSMALYSSGVQIARTTTTQTDLTLFHHYVVTRDGPTVKLYVDGIDVTGVVTNQSLTDTSSALYMGSRGGSSEFLNGSLDEVAVYNAVLSPTTIDAHYRDGRGI